eukprot:9935495-Ditylum_brightwellii.AAC.1
MTWVQILGPIEGVTALKQHCFGFTSFSAFNWHLDQDQVLTAVHPSSSSSHMHVKYWLDGDNASLREVL